MPTPATNDAIEAATLEAWQRAYARAGALPELTSGPWPGNTCSRSGGDALAAWRRWHEPALDCRFSTIEWPWYALFERARVEILASRHLRGVALNLENVAALLPATESAAQLYQLARSALGTSDADRDHEMKPWPTGLNRSTIIDALAEARAVLTDAAAFADRVFPLVRELARCDPPAPAPVPQPTHMPSPTPDAAAQCEEQVEQENGERRTSSRSLAEDIEHGKTDASYIVYSRRWDQVAPASHWHEAALCEPLSLGNDQQQSLRRLAHRLQRRLLAARLRRWSFDQDEGLLDSRRLARLLIPAADPAVFRRESETPVPEACVVLLVDQSGSMRGQRRQVAALSVDLAVRALELCQVRCEVLGYTTGFGSDNPLLRQWQQAGKPPAPGRLNAVRHIIYKSAQQPWRRARRHFGLLLAENFGRENIDGEALVWAASRLRQRSEPRKILVVLSDGVPYDGATVQANGRAYLENHLRAAIARIEAGPIHLAAIGTGQDVGRYYGNALTLRKPDEVAEVLFAHLGDVLSQQAN